MTENHPITPPPELVLQWDREWREQQNAPVIGWSANLLAYITVRAAQWGADQELEACLNCVNKWGSTNNSCADALRAARRPKPLSLKEQAQQSLLRLANQSNNLMAEDAADMETIRRALEQLND